MIELKCPGCEAHIFLDPCAVKEIVVLKTALARIGSVFHPDNAGELSGFAIMEIMDALAALAAPQTGGDDV